MAGRHPSEPVDLDDLERLLIRLSILGFSLAGLGLLGEVLGWWNDTGELLLSGGTLLGIATAVLALVINATKGQVRRVADGVASNGSKLDTVNGKLDSMGNQLDSMDSKLDKLDVIQVELDRQTGVMDRQLAVLGEIRDRL